MRNIPNTMDRARYDDDPSLPTLAMFDPGANTPRRLPTAEEYDALRAMYAESRNDLIALGATLTATDFYRGPRSLTDIVNNDAANAA